MEIISVFIFFIFIVGSVYLLHFLIGDNSIWAKGDERQKRIRQRATMGSWFTIIGYSFLNLASVFPVFDSIASLTIIDNKYLNNGGDILIVAALGYAVAFVMEYYKTSHV